LARPRRRIKKRVVPKRAVQSRDITRGTRMAMKQMRLEGWSYAAISKALGMPVREVREHMHVIINQQRSPAVIRKLKAPGRMPLSVYMSKGRYPHMKPVKSYVKNPPTGRRLKYGRGYSKMPIPGTNASVRAFMAQWRDPNLRHADPYNALSGGRPKSRGTPETPKTKEIPEHLRQDRYAHTHEHHRLEREPSREAGLKMTGRQADFGLEARAKRSKARKGRKKK